MKKTIQQRTLWAGALLCALTLGACAQTDKTADPRPISPMPPVTQATTPTASAPATSAPSNANVHVRQYKAADGAMLTARYDTSTTPPQVTLTLDGQSAVLKQTEAWAKGAVYKAGDLTWEAKGQEATLKQGKKIVKWAEVK